MEKESGVRIKEQTSRQKQPKIQSKLFKPIEML